jgi:hypothetical protein
VSRFERPGGRGVGQRRVGGAVSSVSCHAQRMIEAFAFSNRVAHPFPGRESLRCKFDAWVGRCLVSAR